MDFRNFLVAELARSFGFAFKNRGAESLGDFRYGLRVVQNPENHRNESGGRNLVSGSQEETPFVVCEVTGIPT